MPHRQTQEEWETEMAVKILSFIRNEIYLDLRFLKVALGALAPESDFAVQTFATDGKALRFLPERVAVAFEKNPRFLDRLYLHTVLHCVFSHLWIAPREGSDEAAGGRGVARRCCRSLRKRGRRRTGYHKEGRCREYGRGP